MSVLVNRSPGTGPIVLQLDSGSSHASTKRYLDHHPVDRGKSALAGHPVSSPYRSQSPGRVGARPLGRSRRAVSRSGARRIRPPTRSVPSSRARRGGEAPGPGNPVVQSGVRPRGPPPGALQERVRLGNRIRAVRGRFDRRAGQLEAADPNRPSVRPERPAPDRRTPPRGRARPARWIPPRRWHSPRPTAREPLGCSGR